MSERPGDKVIPLIEEICATRQVTDAEGNVYSSHPTSIPREEGMALYQLVKDKRPARTLEVGMAYGLSSLFLCQALRENGAGTHTAIDPYQTSGWHNIALLNLERAGLRDLVTFYEQPSHVALPRLLDAGERFDVVFIDGSHRFDDAFIDTYYLDRMLDIGGCLVFDDLWMASIRKLVAYLLRNRRYAIDHTQDLSRVSLPQRFKRFARSFLYQPLDPYLLFASPGKGWRHLHLRQNYCVLRKEAKHEEAWDYFVNF